MKGVRLFACLLPACGLLAWAPALAQTSTWEVRAGGVAGHGARDLAEPRSGTYRALLLDAAFSRREGGLTWAMAATASLRDPADAAGERTITEVTEATLSWRAENWGWAVGRQNLVWGRADIVNPTDVWTPRRYDRASFRDSDQAIGADTLRAWVTPGDLGTATVLLSPRLRPSRRGAGLLAALPAVPSHSSSVSGRSPAAAGRWEGQHGALDYALTAATGATLTPYFRPGGATGLESRYARQRMLGGDFARTVGAWVLRGEAAIVRREDDATGVAPRPTRSAVLAAEREIVAGWTANVQWLVEQHGAPAARDPGLERLAALNRTLFHQGRRRVSGASLSVANNPLSGDPRLTFTVLAYEGRESVWRLRWESTLAPRLSLCLLVERFQGPAGSTFDFLSRNNVAWVFLTSSFGGN